MSFTGNNGSTYSFKITTVDHSGLNTVSSCSGNITIDTTHPISASNLTTAADSATGPDARYDDDTTIYFAWTASSSADVSSYSLHRYNQANCSGSSSDTSGITGNSQNFTGNNGSTYSFKVTTIDNGGLNTTSSCSGNITIDTTPPTNPIIVINGDANHVTTTRVALTLTAIDASQMYLTNTAGCHDGGTWQS
jgi:hypothetical protein